MPYDEPMSKEENSRGSWGPSDQTETRQNYAMLVADRNVSPRKSLTRAVQG